MSEHAQNIVDSLVDGKITPEAFNHFAAAMGEKLSAELEAKKEELAKNFFTQQNSSFGLPSIEKLQDTIDGTEPHGPVSPAV